MRPGPRARSTSERPAVSREYGSPFGCPTRNLRPRVGTTWNPHAVSNVAGQSAILLAEVAADCCRPANPHGIIAPYFRLVSHKHHVFTVL